MTTSRTPPPWRRAFLRALARSGSVAMAAERCGIDRSSAYQLRNRNPAFAASWDRAQAAAREGLTGVAASHSPPSASSEGEMPRSDASTALDPNGKGRRAHKRPLLRPAECIRSSKTGKCCIMRTGPGRWSAAKEALFLAELTATANVKAAARAAGVSTVTVYNRRKLWPAFKAEWDAAVAEAIARLDTLVVCAATTTLDPEPLPERAYQATEMSMEQAIKIWLALNARERSGRKRRLGGPPRREPGIEEIRQEILRKVAAIKRARQNSDQDFS